MPETSPDASRASVHPTAQATAQAIVQAGVPVLRSRAAEVPPERIRTPEFQALLATMIATMRDAPGVGLAAPQIGLPWRVIVLEDREDFIARASPQDVADKERVAFAPRVFVNPVLHAVGDETATFFEGCLSVSGFVALVERRREVSVTGLDEEGVERTWRVRGWPARILQHEVDHLDGTLYIDRMMTRSFGAAAETHALYAGKSIAEVREMLGI